MAASGSLIAAVVNQGSIYTSYAYNPTPSPSSIPTISPTIPTEKLINFPTGAPFYGIALIIVVCILYGIVLIRLRDWEKNIVYVPTIKMCTTLALFGSTFLSEMVYVTALLLYNSEGLKVCASIILIARSSYLVTGYYLIKLYSSRRYLSLIDTEHMLRNRYMYIPLFIFIFLDCTNIAFLPWLSTRFSMLSSGYPDIKIYKSSIVVKMIQSFTSAVLQLAALAQICNIHGGFAVLNIVSRAFLIISIVSSSLSFLVTLLGVVIQYKILEKLNDDDNDIRATTIEISSPLGIRIGILYLNCHDILSINIITDETNNTDDSKKRSSKIYYHILKIINHISH